MRRAAIVLLALLVAAPALGGRLFSDENNDFLSAPGAVVSDSTITLHSYVSFDEVRAHATISVFVAGSGSDGHVQLVGSDSWGYMLSRDTGDAQAATANTVSQNTWTHVTGVVSAADSRTVWVDADDANKGTDATSKSPSGMDETYIGTLFDANTNNLLSGTVAFVAAWDEPLSFEQVDSLNEGAWVPYVASGDLASLVLLRGQGSTEVDIVSGLVFTDENGTTKAGHKNLCPMPGVH